MEQRKKAQNEERDIRNKMSITTAEMAVDAIESHIFNDYYALGL